MIIRLIVAGQDQVRWGLNKVSIVFRGKVVINIFSKSLIEWWGEFLVSCKCSERWVHDISVWLRMEGRDDAIAWVKVMYRFQMLIEEVNFWE